MGVFNIGGRLILGGFYWGYWADPGALAMCACEAFGTSKAECVEVGTSFGGVLWERILFEDVAHHWGSGCSKRLELRGHRDREDPS